MTVQRGYNWGAEIVSAVNEMLSFTHKMERGLDQTDMGVNGPKQFQIHIAAGPCALLDLLISLVGK